MASSTPLSSNNYIKHFFFKQEPHTKIKEFGLSKYSKEYAHRTLSALLCKFTKVLRVCVLQCLLQRSQG